MITAIMTEEFIHFLWKFRMFDRNLETTSGMTLQVIQPGEHNTDSGPDFFNARIRIGGTLWAGNVEMHVLSSDWNRHQHGTDPAYANTILHVVFSDDAEINLPSGEPIPTLVIEGKYPRDIYSRYEALMQNRTWIPCSKLLPDGIAPEFDLWAPSLSVERLLSKSNRIREIHKNTSFGWEETLYQWMARGFGFRINAFPFEMLSRSLPYRILCRYRNNALQVEALLFGQAGLSGKANGSDYPRRLSLEYGFLKAKHHLEPIGTGMWKFLRLRPSNFPTIRISQFGDLISRRESPLSFMLGCPGPEELGKWFDIRAAGFWDDHYTFDRLSPACEKKLGASSAHLLAVNVIAPWLFYYGLEKDQPKYREHALQLLESLPAEDNLDIRRWKDSGIEVRDALRTQALLQLKTCYCDARKCLKCRIGKLLLNRQNGNG